MTEKRSRRRLFGKPIPNPIDQAANTTTQIGKDLAQARSDALAIGNDAIETGNNAVEIGKDAVETDLGSTSSSVADSAAAKIAAAAEGPVGGVGEQAKGAIGKAAVAGGLSNELDHSTGVSANAAQGNAAQDDLLQDRANPGAVLDVSVEGVVPKGGVQGGLSTAAAGLGATLGSANQSVSDATESVANATSGPSAQFGSSPAEAAADSIKTSTPNLADPSIATFGGSSGTSRSAQAPSTSASVSGDLGSSNSIETGGSANSAKAVNSPQTVNSGNGAKTLNAVNTSNSANKVKTTEWVPSRRRRILPLVLGAAGLIGLTGIQAFAAKGKVEDDLRKQSLKQLNDEFPDLKVSFDGRDARIAGTVADAESRRRAHDLVRRIKGVRHVEDAKVASPAPADVAAEAQVPLTIDTVFLAAETAADGMASIAAVTGDTVPETTIATPAVTTAAPAVAVDTSPAETIAAATVPVTIIEPTTIEPTTLEPTTLEPTIVVPASVLATSVPTTIVVAPVGGEQPVATVVPAGEPIEPIHFGRASTDLEATSGGDLNRIAAFLSANPNIEIGVAGYADARGTKLQNLALTKARAENVKQALIDRGIAGDRISAVWFGDRSPVADNASEDGRAFNRRVEFRFFNSEVDAAAAFGQDVSFTG